MKVNRIPAHVLTAYVAGLSPYVPGLTETRLVAALRGFDPDGSTRRNALPDRMLSLKEAAGVLGVSWYTVRNMVRDGRLHGTRATGEWRIPAANVRELADPEGLSA